MIKFIIAIGILFFGFSGLAQAQYIGNKESKLFFPEDCAYVKMMKAENKVAFKTPAEAVAAGYKESSKCKSGKSDTVFVGNKDSKLFFPSDCSYANMIKKENKVTFKTAEEAIAAGYKASSKCAAEAKEVKEEVKEEAKAEKKAAKEVKLEKKTDKKAEK